MRISKAFSDQLSFFCLLPIPSSPPCQWDFSIAMGTSNSTACRNGVPQAVLPSVRAVVGITCVLSMFGAILIILSYLLIKEIRTKAREILVHLSLMDFMVATANFVGVTVNFDQYLSDTKHHYYSERTYNVVNILCKTQASFAMYGTESSILWTIAIAVYIYFRIMFDKKPVARRAVYVFYIICYGLPLIMTLWYSIDGKLGYSRFGGSGWCSLVLAHSNNVYPFDALLGNDMWLYLTIFLVPVIFVSLYFYLRFEVCYTVLCCVTLLILCYSFTSPSHITSPTHTTPTHTSPSHIFPSHITPTHIFSSHITPTHISPSHLTSTPHISSYHPHTHISSLTSHPLR